MEKLDLGSKDLEDIVGALLEVEETGQLSRGTERTRRLVELAMKGAEEAPQLCSTPAFVDGTLYPCSLESGHPGRCSYRAVKARPGVESPAEDDLGSLDDLLAWVPDPEPLRAEILALLAKLPALAELDRVAELVGQLAALVDAPERDPEIT